MTNAYTESLHSLIRVMNRLGRGYSFEALRAKILFTEGAHKGKAVLTPRKSHPKAEHSHEPPGPPNSYGADINTLIELLESGRL